LFSCLVTRTFSCKIGLPHYKEDVGRDREIVPDPSPILKGGDDTCHIW